MGSRRPACQETTIRTSIRIRPCSAQERETFPGPSPVQAAPGEVRLFQRALTPGSGRSSPSHGMLRSRPGTPTSPRVPGGGASSTTSVGWRAQAAAAAQHQLSNEYQSYAFANVFAPEDGNEEVYGGSGCKDVVSAVLGGCNGTIFVYGQTGAGKTHTMDALTDLVLQQLYAAAGAEDSGAEVAISISVVELYNEVLRCLLSTRENLQLRWASGAGSVAGVVLEGAEERPCGSIEEAAAIITMAKASRAVGETRANTRSSRSHLIARIKVEVLQLGGVPGVAGSPTGAGQPATAAGGSRRAGSPAPGAKPAAMPAMVSFSMLNLVDLAGSERIDKTGSSDTPLRLREALNINKSLLCLGNVVSALSERADGSAKVVRAHIPYRDSKLTRLLEDSLGGNATTALIACITPLPEWHLEQSRNTLEFAARAARVVCKPQRNVVSLNTPSVAAAAGGADAGLVAALQAEVQALKRQLAEQQLLQSPLPSPSPSPSPLQQHAVHNVPILPISSSVVLWEGRSPTAAAADRGSSSQSAPPSPSGSRPTSFRNRARAGGWSNRLRVSLGGSGGYPAGAQEVGGSPGARWDGLGSPPRAPGPAWACVQRPATDSFTAQGCGSPAADAGSPSGGAAAAAAADGSAQLLAHASRTSGAHRSLLWKLLQQQHPHEHQPGSSSTSDGLSGSPFALRHGGHAHSLKSAGLLMTPAGNVRSAVDRLARWATFNGRLSSGGGGAAAAAAAGQGGRSSSAAAGLEEQQQWGAAARPSGSLTGRASLMSARRLSDGLPCIVSGATSAGLDSCLQSRAAASASFLLPGLESRAAVAEAALALRDHIIKQLATALQQRKAEIRSLKEQLAAVLAQLESSEGEGEASKAKLRELAEGIQMLAAARQADFEKWKGHLVGMESALQAAHQESVAHRVDSKALVQRLGALQAKYDMLHAAEQQQRASLVAGAGGSQAGPQDGQLAATLRCLQDIEAALQQHLAKGAGPASPRPSLRRQLSTCLLSAREQPNTAADGAMHGTSSGGDSSSSKCGVSSHSIQTVSTRVLDTTSVQAGAYDSPHSLAAAAGEAADAARVAHIEVVLAELQTLLPTLQAAAAAAMAANAATTAAAATRAAGASLALCSEQQQHADGAAGPDQAPTHAGKVSATGTLLTGPGAAKCHRCDSLKPLLVIMQKLKDEAILLKAAMRTRDAQLAAADDEAGGLRRDLQGARHQVDALQERIDELSEDLEAARSAAAAATASASAAPRAGSDCSSSGGDKQQYAPLDIESECSELQLLPRTLPLSPGRKLSRHDDAGTPACHELHRNISGKQAERAPLMADNTPLQELHAQILQSWHALWLPFAYRCAFVLGQGVGSSGCSGCSGSSTSNRQPGAAATVAAAAAASGADDGAAVEPAAAADSSSKTPGAAAGPPAAAGSCNVPPPWHDRAQCLAHIALLACLHQYHEDAPAAAAHQQAVLAEEAVLLEAGMEQLPDGEVARLLQQWGVPAAAEAPAARTTAALLARLWAPGAAAATSADRHAAASADACQAAFRAAPAERLAAIALRCNAALIAATSNALADMAG